MGKKNADIDSLMSDIDEREKEREKRDIERAPAPEPAHDISSPITYTSTSTVSSDGTISFEHFAAIDIRVGRIMEVEEHPTARKPMYKLRVDLGDLGVRQIVAGIKSFYSKDELIGRNIIVVANLAPRKIAGIESQGMLLAAEDGADVALIRPDRDFRAGTKIG